MLYSHILDIDSNEVIIVTGSNVPKKYYDNFVNLKNLYFGLTPATPFGSYIDAKKAGFDFIACSENNFTNKQDLELYKTALGFRAHVQSYPQYILTDQEWKDALFFVDEEDKTHAIKNRKSSLIKCKAEIKKAELFKPQGS